MITRNEFKYLEQWAENVDRMPLILRGARQVGKTTLVNQFQLNLMFFYHSIWINQKIICCLSSIQTLLS